MLNTLSVILVHTRFPENIGMTARAMANMGVGDLVLVAPERFEPEKAIPLATRQGETILRSARLEPDLALALKPFSMALGTTARTGGWRSAVLHPEQGAQKARACARQGGRVALVFGPEDKGLCNQDIALCSNLVCIPTAIDNSSLNLAQAVLLLLYECAKADTALAFTPDNTKKQWARPAHKGSSRRATLDEEQILLVSLQKTLQKIGHLPQENPEWFMQPMRRFIRKSRLARHEFDMLMGICRQIQIHTNRDRK